MAVLGFAVASPFLLVAGLAEDTPVTYYELAFEPEVHGKPGEYDKLTRRMKLLRHEIEKLDAKIALIQYRLKHLEIESDIDGVVLQCDLEDARGAPVQRGDVLAEISPLTQLKIEVDIHEKDVRYVQVGQSVTIVLDGSSSERITESIGSIHPMSEIRNGENVFVAEMSIANDDQRLRPGMHGRAKIMEGFRPIGWILFHRPVQKLSSLIR